MNEELKNISLWLTRPPGQAENLTRLLQERGARVYHLPMMRIATLPVDKKQETKIKKLAKYDMAFFISTNAAQIGMELIETYFPKFPEKITYFAPGPTTARVLENFGLKVAYPEKAMSTEALLILPELRKIIQDENKRKKRAIIFRGKGGRELLANTLRAKGIAVSYIELYERRLPDYNDRYLKDFLLNKKPDGIIFTSAEAMHNFVILFEAIFPDYKSTPVFVSSNRLETLARKIGFETINLLNAADDDSVSRGIKKLK